MGGFESRPDRNNYIKILLALISFVTVGMTGFFNLGTGNSMALLYYEENKNENANNQTPYGFSYTGFHC